jgi:hypothetical protein
MLIIPGVPIGFGAQTEIASVDMAMALDELIKRDVL